MKYYLLMISMLFVGISVYSQQRISWGVKGGFNSGISIIDKLSVDGEDVEYPESIYKIGITGNVFIRLNLKKMYVQMEPEAGIIRGAFSYKFINEYDKPSAAELSWELYSAGVSLPIGYHFIKKSHNEFNLFAGPKISKIFSSRNVFDVGSDTYSMDYKFIPYNYSLLCGIGVAISGLFFDFRYEFGLTSYIDNITYSSDINTKNPFGEITLKSRMNAMSFSLGIIF